MYWTCNQEATASPLRPTHRPRPLRKPRMPSFRLPLFVTSITSMWVSIPRPAAACSNWWDDTPGHRRMLIMGHMGYTDRAGYPYPKSPVEQPLRGFAHSSCRLHV